MEIELHPIQRLGSLSVVFGESGSPVLTVAKMEFCPLISFWGT